MVTGLKYAWSRMDQYHFKHVNKRIWIKRDDELELSGNKARKLYWLLKEHASFFKGKTIYSYGGVQGNAMLAVAQLAQMKQVPFTYFTRPVSKMLKSNPEGNFQSSLELGMNHIELSPTDYRALFESQNFDPLLDSPLVDAIKIPQGVHCDQAELGLQALAREIQVQSSHSSHGQDPIQIVLPAGTGTTAFYLAKHLCPTIDVYCFPCVGSSEYLMQQFTDLEGPSGMPSNLHILELAPGLPKSAFGKPTLPLWSTYSRLQHESPPGFPQLDLLYAVPTWHALFRVLDCPNSALSDPKSILLYVHCGGVSGNASQERRYERILFDTRVRR